MKVLFSDTFLDELDRLEQRLASEVSTVFAIAYVDALLQQVGTLADLPARFALRPELGERTHALVFRGRYVVSYRIDPGEVVVLRLFGPGQER